MASYRQRDFLPAEKAIMPNTRKQGVLLDTMFERVLSRGKRALGAAPGPCSIFKGLRILCRRRPEYLEVFGVGYNGMLIQPIHDYDCLVMAHCHGDTNKVMEKFVPECTDGLHQVESP